MVPLEEYRTLNGIRLTAPMYSKTLAYLEINLIAILSSSRRGYKTSPIARCLTELTGFLVSKGGGAAAGLCSR